MEAYTTPCFTFIFEKLMELTFLYLTMEES